MLPFALFPLSWLANRDHPVLSLGDVQGIIRVLFPGARGIFLGLTGPRLETHLVVIKWLKALAQNVFMYMVVGTTLVLILQMAKSLSRITNKDTYKGA